MPAGWKLVDAGKGRYVACNPNAWKYDTSYAGNAKWGLWADGSQMTVSETTDADLGNNRDAALYFVAAGMMDQEWFNQQYGQ